MLDAVLRNTRGFTGDLCSSDGRSRARGGAWPPFAVTGNTSDPNRQSLYRAFLQRVFLMPIAGYQNDVIARELGHHIDYIRSGDTRFATNDQQEVAEGIADMFAYDFDREDATLGEDSSSGKNTEAPIWNWATGRRGLSALPAPPRAGPQRNLRRRGQRLRAPRDNELSQQPGGGR